EAGHINSLARFPFISLRVAHLGTVAVAMLFEPLPRSDKCGTPQEMQAGDAAGGPADVMPLPRAGAASRGKLDHVKATRRKIPGEHLQTYPSCNDDGGIY